ncbi:MAG: DUF5317 family protein [Actinoplanes sp.]
MSLRFFLLTIAPPLAGVGLGYLLGGRLAGFRHLRIRALWLLWVAAGVQLLQYESATVRRFAEETLGVPMLALVFGIVLAWFAVNLRQWPRAIRVAGAVIVLGAVLNGLAIAANGRMPYDPAAVAAVGLPTGVQTPKNVPAGEHTRLAGLGDVIPVPGLRKVVSAGDLLIGAGAAAFVALAMRLRRRDDNEGNPHDPNGDVAADRSGDLHAGSPGEPALHGGRADDRGQLT